MENYSSVGAGAHRVKEIGSFWPNFDPHFSNISKMPLFRHMPEVPTGKIFKLLILAQTGFSFLKFLKIQKEKT